MQPVWFDKYPRSVKQTIDLNEYSSVLDVFKKSVQKFSVQPAFTCMGKTLSYQQLDVQSDHFASFLQHHLKLVKGDRIAIQMPNVLQFPIALFGAIKAGLIVVNTNPLYTAAEMKHQFNDAGVRAVVILANSAHHLEAILKETKVEHVVLTEIGDLLGFPKKMIVNFVVKKIKKMVPSYSLPKAIFFQRAIEIGMQKAPQIANLGHEDICFLQYTGGTTGVSKGAMLTHKNVVANMLQIFAWMSPRLKEGQEVVITPLPLYHIFSLTVNCLAIMAYGGHNILITNPRDIPAFIIELKKWKFTVVTGLNTLFNALMNHSSFSEVDFSHCKISVAGGMALQKAVAQRWKDVTRSDIVEGYGLTETSPVLTCNPIDGTDIMGTIGLPLPSTEVKLIGEDGNEVAAGESGELVARGPQVMKGYWNRQDETDKVLSSDGWLKTGDIAVVDANGFFKIVDRKKDMIIVSGFNVYPNEVEDALMTHPAVLEVAVVGANDIHSGEVVKAFVVKKAAVTEKELIDHARKTLTSYKVPKLIEFRKELPKTNVGKILRRELRENKN